MRSSRTATESLARSSAPPDRMSASTCRERSTAARVLREPALDALGRRLSVDTGADDFCRSGPPARHRRRRGERRAPSPPSACRAAGSTIRSRSHCSSSRSPSAKYVSATEATSSPDAAAISTMSGAGTSDEQTRHATGELGRDADVRERLRAPSLASSSADGPSSSGSASASAAAARPVAGHGLGDVERAAPVAEEPAGRPLEQDARSEQHRGLRRRRHLARRAPRSRPRGSRSPTASRAAVYARAISSGAAPVSSPSRKTNVVPARLTRSFDDPRRDDLAPQRVTLQLLGEALAQAGREVELELAREVRVVGQVGGEQRLRERDLRVREQHRELGRGQAAAGRRPLVEAPRSLGRASSSRLSAPACSRLRM